MSKNDNVNFRDLPREEQLDLINHVLDGGSLQVLDELWCNVDYLPEYEDGIYRKSIVV